MCSRQPRGPRWLFQVSAIALLLIFGGECFRAAAQSAEGVAAILPADVERLWRWFPADSETMIVARDVQVQSPFEVPEHYGDLTEDERRVLQQQAFVDITKHIALGRLLALGGGNMIEAGKYLALLGENSLPLVVYGGRAYQHVSAFGTVRYHGASVVVVGDEAQTDLDSFMAAVAKEAAETRNVDGHKVFFFPASKDEMEPVFKLEPWQGTYLTRIAPNILLCATSDVYLKEMLARIAKPPADLALPTELPLWKYVDATASTWGMRRNPPVDKQQLAGLVWLMQPAGRPNFEAYYLPAPGGDVEFAAKSWFKRLRNGMIAMDPNLEELVDVHPDGVTQVTIPIGEIGRRVKLPVFQVYGLQGHLATW